MLKQYGFHSRAHNDSRANTQYSTQWAGQTYRISQHQFNWRTTPWIGCIHAYMLKIYKCEKSWLVKSFQRTLRRLFWKSWSFYDAISDPNILSSREYNLYTQYRESLSQVADASERDACRTVQSWNLWCMLLLSSSSNIKCNTEICCTMDLHMLCYQVYSWRGHFTQMEFVLRWYRHILLNMPAHA